MHTTVKMLTPAYIPVFVYYTLIIACSIIYGETSYMYWTSLIQRVCVYKNEFFLNSISVPLAIRERTGILERHISGSGATKLPFNIQSKRKSLKHTGR